ncbi:MAG TPA: DUF1843 domain-containing protein [Candidatus Angelobacter sp.]|nr:DUF1843 domain-containing protein [Candidatus Angelobacter sp.]
MSLIPLYGVTIHKCIVGGNLDEMRKLAAQAEKHLAEHGDVGAALEALKIEIARIEHKKH